MPRAALSNAPRSNRRRRRARRRIGRDLVIVAIVLACLTPTTSALRARPAHAADRLINFTTGEHPDFGSPQSDAATPRSYPEFQFLDAPPGPGSPASVPPADRTTLLAPNGDTLSLETPVIPALAVPAVDAITGNGDVLTATDATKAQGTTSSPLTSEERTAIARYSGKRVTLTPSWDATIACYTFIANPQTCQSASPRITNAQLDVGAQVAWSLQPGQNPEQWVSRAAMAGVFFNLNTIEGLGNWRVKRADLRVWVEDSAACTYGSNAAPTPATELEIDTLKTRPEVPTWSTPFEPEYLVKRANFARAGRCSTGAGWETVDVSDALRLWLSSRRDVYKKNLGLMLAPSRSGQDCGNVTFDPNGTLASAPPCQTSWKTFTSMEGAAAQRPQLVLELDHQAAQFSQPRAWERDGTRPISMAVYARNTGYRTWNKGGNFMLQAELTKDGVEFDKNLCRFPDNSLCRFPVDADTPSGAWAKFDVTLPNMFLPATYALRWTMVSTESGVVAGEFDAYDSVARVDRLTILPTFALGQPENSDNTKGVNSFTGNYSMTAKDFDLPSAGPAVTLERTYNSLNPYAGWFGNGWTSTYEISLTAYANAKTMVVSHPNGRRSILVKDEDKPEWHPTNGGAEKLSAYFGPYVLTTGDGSATLIFDRDTGRLTSMVTNGIELVLTWVDGKLRRITNTRSDRSLFISWNGARIDHVEAGLVNDNAARLRWDYRYDGDYLVGACDPRNKGDGNPGNDLCTRYRYDGVAPRPGWPKQLTSVQSPALAQKSTAQRQYYDTRIVYWGADKPRKTGKVLYLCEARAPTCTKDASYRWSFNYRDNAGARGADAAYDFVMRDPRGNTTEYRHDVNGNVVVAKDAYGQERTYRYEYTDENGRPRNQAGLLSKITDENGNRTFYVYDDKGRLARSSVEYDTQANGDPILATKYFDYGDDGGAIGHVTAERDARSDSGTDDRYATRYGYGPNGNLIWVIYPAPDANGNETRQDIAYTDGTETAIDAPGACATATPRNCMPRGMRRSESVIGTPTLATVYAYDARGDLRRIDDPSGLRHTLRYDDWGRLLSETSTCTGNHRCDVAETTVTYTYNELGAVTSTTSPRSDDAFPDIPTLGSERKVAHQQQVRTEYDANGRATKVTVHDLAPLGTPDLDRVTTTEYDDDGRIVRTIAPGFTRATAPSTRYNAAGQPYETVDTFGTVTHLDLDRLGRTTATWVLNVDDNALDGTDTKRNIRISAVEYFPNGLVRAQIDALGNRVEQQYAKDGLKTRQIFRGFTDRAGRTRDITLVTNEYGPGRFLVRSITGDDNPRYTRFEYDRRGRVTKVVTDPDGAAITQTTAYDAASRPVSRMTSSPNRPNVGVQISAYDESGNVVQTSTAVYGGPETVLTKSDYDQRGQMIRTASARTPGAPLSTDDPTLTTEIQYDALGRAIGTTGPRRAVTTVNAKTGSATDSLMRPVTLTSYNTFGEVWRTQDAFGNVVKPTLDPKTGRTLAITKPAYTPPGTTTPLKPRESWQYDRAGRVIAAVDVLGNTTNTWYDTLGRAFLVAGPRDPALSTSTDPQNLDGRAVTRASFDLMGRPRVAEDPTGARVETTYDALGRVRSTELEVRALPGDSAPSRATTEFAYNEHGQATWTRDPNGLETQTAYSELGEATSVTTPNGAITETTYDALSRPLAIRAPDGSTTTTTYNTFGHAIATEQRGPTNALIARTETTYNLAGQPTAVRSPIAVATGTQELTRYQYNSAGQLTGADTPTTTDATTGFGAISSTYSYDKFGNLARATDGRQNTTLYASNAWGLPEATIEPSSAAYPNLADRTYTRSYTTAGAPATDRQPGGVTINRAYDALGRLITEAGTGGVGTTRSRQYFYDVANRPRAVASGADRTNATDRIDVTYDDRGLVRTVGTPGANPTTHAAYRYDAGGRVTTRIDGAGAATFGYDPTSGALSTYAVVPPSGTALQASFGYDAMLRLTSVGYAQSNDRARRDLVYAPNGQVTTDTLRDSTNTITYQTTSAFDPGGQLTTKTIAGSGAGNGAGTHEYTYNRAGRLTGYTAPGQSATAYSYDASGNRTQAGTRQATYDARGRLQSTTDGSTTSTYTWDPRGTLQREQTGAQTIASEFDAFGRLTKVGAASYTYDALDRVTSRTTSAGAANRFAYSGAGTNPISDGTTSIIPAPSGEPFALRSGNAPYAFALRNAHNDLVGTFTANGTLTGTSSTDPWGAPSSRDSSRKVAGNFGFQSDYTDPDSQQVWMNARWYLPKAGTFSARDSVLGDPTNPVSMNRYAYGNNDPANHWDPSGHDATALGAADAAIAQMLIQQNAEAFTRYVAPYAANAWLTGLNKSGAEREAREQCGSRNTSCVRHSVNFQVAMFALHSWELADPDFVQKVQAQMLANGAWGCGFFANCTAVDAVQRYAQLPNCVATGKHQGSSAQLNCAQNKYLFNLLTRGQKQHFTRALDQIDGVGYGSFTGEAAQDKSIALTCGGSVEDSTTLRVGTPRLTMDPSRYARCINLAMKRDNYGGTGIVANIKAHPWKGAVAVVAAAGAAVCIAATEGICGVAIPGLTPGLAAVGTAALAGGLAYTAVSVPTNTFTAKGLAANVAIGAIAAVATLAVAAGISKVAGAVRSVDGAAVAGETAASTGLRSSLDGVSPITRWRIRWAMSRSVDVGDRVGVTYSGWLSDGTSMSQVVPGAFARIDDTPAGRALLKLNLYEADPALADEAWSTLSRRYASQFTADDTVYVFAGDAMRAESIFKNVELPILQRNGVRLLDGRAALAGHPGVGFDSSFAGVRFAS